jgi:hypothetical protein
MAGKKDLKLLDRIAREAGIPHDLRPEFGRYIERCKRNAVSRPIYPTAGN